MPTETPLGPIYQPTLESIVIDADYTISYLPDKNNGGLKVAGEKETYYYLPVKPRLDRDNDGKSYKATLTLFQGVLNEADQVGVKGTEEVAGGILTLTTDLEVPAEILDKANKQLIEKLGYDVNIAPVMLQSNKIRLDKLTDGATSSLMNFTVQGEGDAATNPGGTNAFTINLGRGAAEIVEGSFTENTSQIVVRNDISFYLWLPITKIHISGNWSKIFDHFSTAFSAKAYFFKVDISNEIQSLVTKGSISVEYDFGPGISDDAKKEIRTNAQHVLETFMSQATTLIFDQQPPDVKPAEANAPNNGGGLFGSIFHSWWTDYSAAFSMKKVKISNDLQLDYEEIVNEQKSFTSSLSSQMEGIYQEISKNKQAKDKYIKKIILGQEFFRKRIIKMSSNIPAGEKIVTSIECQIGVKNLKNDVQRRPFADGFFDTNTDTPGKIAIRFLPGSNIAYYLVYDIVQGNNNESVFISNTFRLSDGKIITTKEYEEKSNSINIALPPYNFLGELTTQKNLLDTGQFEITISLKINDTEVEYVFDKDSGYKRDLNVYSLNAPLKCSYKYQVNVFGKKVTDPLIFWESEWIENSITGKEQRLSVLISIPEDKKNSIDAYLG